MLVRTRQRHAVPAGHNEPADEHGRDPGGEGSTAASRKNELPEGDDLAGSSAESSKAPASSARETDEDSRSCSEGSAGSRSDRSSTMAQITSLTFAIQVCFCFCQSMYLVRCAAMLPSGPC